MKRFWITLLLSLFVLPSHATAQDWLPMPQTTLTIPVERIGHVMSDDPTHGQVILFGGVNSSFGQVLSDMWIWDGSSWEQELPSVVPPGRAYSAMAFDTNHEQLVMFGGQAQTGQFLGDTWVWDGTSWTQKFPVTSPSGRTMHAMACDPIRKQIVLFGGFDGSTPSGLNDTWIWSGKRWTQAHPTNLPRSSSRVLMSYDAINQAVLLYDEAFRETWLWDGSDWHKQSPLTTPPIRQASSLARFTANNQLILFGGADPLSGTPLNDTWSWDGTNWNNLPAFLRNLEMSARAGSVLSSGPGGSVLLFGGQLGSPFSLLNETWAFFQFPFLSFPLQNQDPFLAAISTVMDHSVKSVKASGDVIFYGTNNSVMAYTGDEGVRDCGLVQCVQGPPLGYKSTVGTSFATNLPNYTGGGGCLDLSGAPISCEFWLFYEGHPGYDYPVDIGTDVFAPASGIAFIPDCDPIQRRTDCDGTSGVAPGTAVDGFNILTIDHGNGYSTWYLHLGDLELVQKEPAVIPEFPNQVTVVHSGQGIFQGSKKVVFAGSGLELTQVSSVPGPGQYATDSTGIYTFNAADSGSSVKITYFYQAADFRTIQCPNQTPITLHRGDGQRVPVTPDCVIARTGNKAIDKNNFPDILGPHLHFEVRKGLRHLPNGSYQCLRPACVPVDPYGWSGLVKDPYPAGPNLFLWRFIFAL